MADWQQGWMGKRQQWDLWIGIGLLIASLLLFTINLGSLPLRDWDEGLVAQVAKEIWQAPAHTLTWLHPTLWGQPYFNKPPLVHSLIAVAYSIAGVNEWTARLPGAILSALSVPLLYLVGREIFYLRLPAIFAALVYLTLLPVARQGRLAMLDGAVLCCLLLMIGCLLRARRDVRYALGFGIGFTLLCLTKGIMVGGLLGTIALIFIAWDTPRLLRTIHLWLALLLGLIPVLLWYVAQVMHYGQSFLGTNLVDQSLQRIWAEVESNSGPPWYYLLEILKYSAPWLLFLPLGIKRAWNNRNLSWARLVLVWGGVYLLAISLMTTKLPWYVLPLYPAFALIVGAVLAELWQKGHLSGSKYFAEEPYSPAWMWWFILLAIVTWAGAVYFIGFHVPQQLDVALMLSAVAMTMTLATVLVKRQNPQFIVVLIWGCYVALLLLMTSPRWVWELGESYPVKPVAALVQQHTQAGDKVYTSYPHNRPSLNFYSDRQVLPAAERDLNRIWRRRSHPYLLLDESTLKTLDLQPAQLLGTAEGWSLITKMKQ